MSSSLGSRAEASLLCPSLAVWPAALSVDTTTRGQLLYLVLGQLDTLLNPSVCTSGSSFQIVHKMILPQSIATKVNRINTCRALGALQNLGGTQR